MGRARRADLRPPVGRESPPEDGRTLDEINQAVFLQNQTLAAADVREREAVGYQRLLGLVERASEADLFDAKRFTWTEGLPFADWIAGNSYGHYEEHGIGL
ncbi:MAG TPA: ClbS/DfsB family four-helix bundle protein [Anaerolineaceae bacterium]